MTENFEIKTDTADEKEEKLIFSKMTDSQIEELKKALGLSMSFEDLIFCREYYREKKYEDISIDTLRLLDTIATEARRNPENVSIAALETNDRNMFETYIDLNNKQAIIARQKNSPLALTDAPDVANGYSKITRKRTPALLRMSDIHKEDGTPLFPITDELCKLHLTLAPATAFLLVCPADPMSDAAYLRAVEDFLSCEGIANTVILARRISHGGIAAALAELSSGVLADIYAIPEVPEGFMLSHLATEHHGRFIIAIRHSQIEFASAIAEYYGLSLSHFAKVILGERLVFVPNNNINDTVDTRIVRALSSPSLQLAVGIKEEVTSAPDAIVLSESHRGSEACNLPYGAIHLRGNLVSSVCASRLGDTPFSTSLYTAISAILPILATGIDRSDVSLKLRYTLADATDSESLGNSLAAMLGIYRVMSELYISGESFVEYTNNTAPSISVAAFADRKKTKVLKKLIREHSGVYLFSFDRTEDGLPNFENFRAMCDFYRECVVNKYSLSAAAVNGNIADTLAAMRSEFECRIADSAKPFLAKPVLGIIVESSSPLRHGVFLGSTTRVTDAI